MEEIWKDIPGYEGKYQASTFGRIRSLVDYRIGRDVEVPHIMKQRPARHGYLACHIGKKQIKVHRLVAVTYVENPFNKPQVNHKDGNKLNNRPENLEWVTMEENENHALQNGLIDGFRATASLAKPVSQFSLSGEHIQTFWSAGEASRKTGVFQSQITSCCLKKKGFRTAGGYTWRFESEAKPRDL